MQSPLQGLSRWFSWPALRIPAIALLLLNPGSGRLLPQAWAQTETEGAEVLTRGPVHEAFAATINFTAHYSSGGHGYDPIYAHERWRNRDDDRWQRRHEDDFAYYRDHESARPPHTLAALGPFLSRPDRNRRVESDFATRLDQVDERKISAYRLKKVNEAEQKAFVRRGQEIRDFGDQRRKRSDRGAVADRPDRRGGGDDADTKPKATKPVRARMPKSPVMARAEEGTVKPRTEPAPETKRQPKREAKPKPKREPSSEPESAAPSPPRKKPKASPTSQPNAPSPAPEKPKRGKAKPDPDAEKKKKKDGQD